MLKSTQMKQEMQMGNNIKATNPQNKNLSYVTREQIHRPVLPQTSVFGYLQATLAGKTRNASIKVMFARHHGTTIVFLWTWNLILQV